MSKQTIIGIREYNFKDEESGRDIAGLSVYYAERLETKNGQIAKGYTSGKFSVRPNTDLYKRMLNANYDKPFEADVTFDILPGSKRPVLADIKF